MVKFRWAQAALTALAAVVFAVGCGGGGGGGGGGNGGGGGQTGDATLSIAWPERSKIVNAPAAALSARIDLNTVPGGTTAVTRTVNRLSSSNSSTQVYQLNEIDPGTYNLVVTFFAESNAGGATVGTATKQVTIEEGNNDLGDVAVVGNATEILVAAGQNVQVGSTQQLTATLEDAQDNALAVSEGSVTWSIVSGDANADLTDDGVITGVVAGSVTVRATYDNGDANLTADQTVTVNPSGPVPTVTLVTDVAGGALSAGFNGISGDGELAVGFGTPGVDNSVVRYIVDTGVLDQIAALGAGQALDANGDGSIIVGNRELGAITAFTWSAGTGVQNLSAAAATTTSASGVNNTGTIVVGSGLVGAKFRAVRWDSGVATFLDNQAPTLQSPDPGSDAADVNDNGNVIVGQADWDSNGDAGGGIGTRPVRWSSSGTIASLGLLAGGTQGRAHAVSAQASSAEVTIVGESGTSTGGAHTEAFRWTQAGGMVGLGDLAGGGNDSRALAVSADGTVIVGEASGPAGTEAFIWDSINGMRSLMQVLTDAGVGATFNGWTLRSANGISRDGKVIVGQAVRASVGETDGFEEAAFIVMLP